MTIVSARVNATPHGREVLQPGVDKPSATTAGVRPDVPLTVTTTHVPASNTVYRNLDIKVDVNLSGKTGVQYENCRFQGGLNSTAQGLVLAQGTHGRGHRFTDCTFDPQSPNFNKDGIRGYGFTLLRCDISGVVDGVSVFCTQAPTADVGVTVQQTWIHDQAYWPNPPDTNHSDGSHCDGIQWQGSPGLVVRGCLISGILDPAYQPGQFGTKHTNSCIMIKPDAGPISNATIVDNWFYGANISVNSNDDAPDRFITNFGTFTGNRFDHDQRAQGGGGNDTWTFLRPVGAAGTFTSNVYEDNGAAIRIRTQ
jgi:hypothetical protein